MSTPLKAGIEFTVQDAGDDKTIVTSRLLNDAEGETPDNLAWALAHFVQMKFNDGSLLNELQAFVGTNLEMTPVEQAAS